VAILEAGISHLGEMDALLGMIQTQILGIFTNIGTAHPEGFSEFEVQAKTKNYPFQSSRICIILL